MIVSIMFCGSPWGMAVVSGMLPACLPHPMNLSTNTQENDDDDDDDDNDDNDG